MNELRKCQFKQFKESFVDALPDGNELATKLKRLPPNHWQYSNVNRLSVMDALSYHFLPDTVHTIVIAYKIQDTTKRQRDSTYALTYVNLKSRKQFDTQLDEDNPAVSPRLFFQGVCPSGSLISKDGEYRSTIIDWYAFNHFVERDAKLKGFYSQILRYLTSKIKQRRYLLAIDYFFPNDDMKINYFFEAELLASEQKIAFFAVSWFNFFFTMLNGMAKDSVNQHFTQLLLRYKTEDVHFLRFLFKNTDHKVVMMFRYLTNNNMKRSQLDRPDPMQKIKLGQKLCPLNLLEIQHPFNIAFQPWKELLISKRATSLVLNHVTPGFPLATSWILISNCTERLFDNPNHTDKIAQSRSALAIVDVLKQAQVHTYRTTELGEPSERVSMSRTTPWLSKGFKAVFEQIQHPIDFSKEYLIMSNTTLCVFSEFVGKTLYDVLFVSARSTLYKTLTLNMFSDKGSKFFRTLMFELCYNFYCLHAHLGVIHGDPHLNNLTVNPIFYHNNTLTSITKPKVAYFVHDEAFLLDFNYYTLCIIDFSRSILDLNRLDGFVDASIPAIFPLYSNLKYLEDQQSSALLDYLISSKPEYKDHKEALMGLIKYNYNVMFKVLSLLDLYNVSSKLVEFFTVHSKDYKIAAACVELVRKLFQFADRLLNSQLQYVLDNKVYTDILEGEWPTYTVLKSVFLEDLYAGESVGEVLQVYQFESDSTHNLNRESTFPPLLRELPRATCFRDHSAYAEVKKQLTVKKKGRRAFEEKANSNFKMIDEMRHRPAHV